MAVSDLDGDGFPGGVDGMTVRLDAADWNGQGGSGAKPWRNSSNGGKVALAGNRNDGR